MKPETGAMRRIQERVTADPSTRLFRNNVGQAYVGRLMEVRGLGRVLVDPRPIKFGLGVGTSDLIGWQVVTVTPDMVGQRVAVFAAVEVKADTGGQGSAQQRRFIEVVREAGGRAGIARDAEQCLKVLGRK